MSSFIITKFNTEVFPLNYFAGSDESFFQIGLDLDPKITYKFRILDADGIWYFEGFSSWVSFLPKDEFGEAHGCTEIQYYQNGSWTSL